MCTPFAARYMLLHNMFFLQPLHHFVILLSSLPLVPHSATRIKAPYKIRALLPRLHLPIYDLDLI